MKLVPAWSSSSSRTWPFLFLLRGLASSAGALPSVPRLELLVSATYTLPVTGLGSKSSGRSILVAPTLSPAWRVNTATSSADMPSTRDSPRPSSPVRSNGIHSPLPAKVPEAGSVPLPSIASGESPESVAT